MWAAVLETDGQGTLCIQSIAGLFGLTKIGLRFQPSQRTASHGPQLGPSPMITNVTPRLS